MIKLKFIKVSEKIKNIPNSLAEKNFLFFLGLFFISLFLGLIIFYHYVFLAGTSDQTIQEEELLKLDTETQKRVLEEWQKRNETFQEAGLKEYSDPFNIDQ